MTVEQDKIFMREAISLAKQAQAIGEVPVGALIVHEGLVIASAYNQSISTNDPTAHAEILALRQAGDYLNNYRLLNTTLYVTLEPCAMCAMALVHARVSRVVFGAYDYKTGAGGSVYQLLDDEKMNHQLEFCSGVLEVECATLLSDFFKMRRAEKRAEKRASK